MLPGRIKYTESHLGTEALRAKLWSSFKFLYFFRQQRHFFFIAPPLGIQQFLLLIFTFVRDLRCDSSTIHLHMNYGLQWLANFTLFWVSATVIKLDSCILLRQASWLAGGHLSRELVETKTELKTGVESQIPGRKKHKSISEKASDLQVHHSNINSDNKALSVLDSVCSILSFWMISGHFSEALGHREDCSGAHLSPSQVLMLTADPLSFTILPW